jgi:glycosyltransferase involved in cell wall biosynthesis
MTRIGMNPARNRLSNYQPARVTVAVLVYIPFLEGYFSGRLDVLKLCLDSILKNTRMPFDLLIFDNGCCREVKTYLSELQEEGSIQFLITAQENIGKIGALKLIFNITPGELVAYSDDDTFFYPGWLSEQVKLLDAFPRTGMVSGWVVRSDFGGNIQSNLLLAKEDEKTQISRGRFIPEAWIIEWAESTGRDPKQYLDDFSNQEDIILERCDCRAFAASNHAQFISPRLVITQFLKGKWSGRLMGDMYELDNMVDEAGYLRIATVERTTKHIGNVVTQAMFHEASSFSITADRFEPTHFGRTQVGLWKWLSGLRPVRWLMQGLYNRLFWLLSEETGDWLAADKGSKK